jgi:predicted SAM-dependent methyltransferase
MEPESMVHALEQIHDLLKPEGYLIDIHPNGEMVEFIYQIEDNEQFIGYMQETDDYIEYRQADEAIQTVIAKELFQVVKTGEFEFRTYADSFDELEAFLDENWSDAVVGKDVIANAVELEKEHGKRGVFLREQTRIGLFKNL